MKRLASMIAISFIVLSMTRSYAQVPIERHAGRQGWTIKQQDTFTPNDGPKRIEFEQLNYFDGKGHRRERLFGVDGLGKRHLAIDRIYTSQEIFIYNPREQKLIYDGDQEGYLHDADVKVDRWVRGNDYLRDEVVDGWKCAVYRISDSRGNGEAYGAYNLGGFILKIVQHGSEGIRIIEPVSIELGPVSPALIDYHPEWPIDFSEYEQRIEQEEKRFPAAAENMRKMLSEAKIRLAKRAK